MQAYAWERGDHGEGETVVAVGTGRHLTVPACTSAVKHVCKSAHRKGPSKEKGMERGRYFGNVGTERDLWVLTQGDSPGLQLVVHLTGLYRDQHHSHTDHDQHRCFAHKCQRHHVTKPNCSQPD